MTRLDFTRAPWPEVAARVEQGTLAVLAVGACEQHGPHLPLTTDTDMAQGLAARVADALAALHLPPVTYGDAFTAQTCPGTMSVSPDTLRAMVQDLGLGLHRMGVRGLVLVNGHFGNCDPLTRAGRALTGAGLPVLQVDCPGLDALAAAINDSPPAGRGFRHADECETSVMLATAPDAVRMDMAAPSCPDAPTTFGAAPWQLRDISPSGVFGDPRPATAAKGQAWLDGLTASTLALVAQWRARHGI